MSRNTVLHGSELPLSQTRPLRAGPLSAVLDGIDLRYVRHGDVELVRRVYVAVRDRNWNTIPGVAADVEVTERADSFEVHFSVRHRSEDTDFSWNGRIEGTAEGAVSYSMDGTGGRDMLYNRIGFCVLHPWRESAGQSAKATTPGGTVEAVLPDLVAPQRFENGVYVPLFPSASGVEIDLPGDGLVVFAFEGDLFETEDQRNWSDSSLKTYCTPLALGFPHELKRGERRAQSVSVRARRLLPAERLSGPTQITVGERTGAVVADIGLALTSEAGEPTAAELSLLRCLAPAHVRFDAHLGSPELAAALKRALAVAGELGAALELGVFLTAAQSAELGVLREALADAPIARVLVAAADAQTTTPQETTPADLVELVRTQLKLGAVPIAGGTDMYFCELNRTRPVVDHMDGVFWSLNAQVHAFDDISVMETPEAHGEQVRTARSFAAGRKLFVGPVTLRRRYNVNATVAEDQASGVLPDSVDPRQASLLGAAWTLASAKYLAEAGAHSITYFETVGWRGVIQGDRAAPLPDLFQGRPGQAFPLFHVLADVASLQGASIRACTASRTLEVAALAVERDANTTLLLANLTADTQAVEIGGLGANARVRRLGEQTVHGAVSAPTEFRASGELEPMAGLSLSPYETIRIDT